MDCSSAADIVGCTSHYIRWLIRTKRVKIKKQFPHYDISESEVLRIRAAWTASKGSRRGRKPKGASK